jgi:hypothetical protein
MCSGYVHTYYVRAFLHWKCLPTQTIQTSLFSQVQLYILLNFSIIPSNSILTLTIHNSMYTNTPLRRLPVVTHIYSSSFLCVVIIIFSCPLYRGAGSSASCSYCIEYCQTRHLVTSVKLFLTLETDNVPGGSFHQTVSQSKNRVFC